MPARIRVRGELEVLVDELPPDVFELIKSALTFPNEDRETQAREAIPGWWDLPEFITLYRVEERRTGRWLTMPRGFATPLVQGLNYANVAYKIDDERVNVQAAEGYYHHFVMRDYQLAAALDLAKSHQGFYKCPAGGGKTVTMLGLASFLNQRTLVIVDKADLLEQWRERASTFLGLELDFDDQRAVGKIGQGEWHEKDFTIALRQTLASQLDQLNATKWWATWGLTIFDEGHHLSGHDLGEIQRETLSQWMIGTSATPAKSETRGKIVHALVGPIVHETSRTLLRERGILMTPWVRKIATGFETHFHVTHTVSANEECKVPGCKKEGRHQHRNNYASAVKKLVEDADRNALIARTILSEPHQHHLVYSRQLKHLDLIAAAIRAEGYEGDIHFLRGEENARKVARDIVRAIEEADSAIVLSTVADEALDIPILDRLHMVFPVRQDALVEQVVGRIERATEGKEDAGVIDYVDAVNVFQGQAAERDMHYRIMGYTIEEAAAV